MADNQEDATSKNTQNPPNTSAPPPEQKGNNFDKKPDPNGKGEECRYIKQEPPNIIVNFLEQKPEKWSYANRIAAAAVFVTIILIGVTYKLFTEARKQSYAAIRVANSADSTYIEAKKNDNESSIRQRQIFDSTGADTRKRFVLDSESTQEQISTMKKQFEIDNEAYLEVVKPSIFSFAANQEPIVTYEIDNLGKQPVKEYSSNEAIQFVNVDSMDRFIKNPFGFIKFLKPERNSRYFVKEAPLTTTMEFEKQFIITDSMFAWVTTGRICVFLSGNIFYINPVNSKKRHYSYCVQFLLNRDKTKQFPSGTYHYIINYNKDVPFPASKN
jgi:hypothetical protein